MNVACLEDRIVVVSDPVGVAVYDFDFDLHFRCSHPHRFAQRTMGVLRIGGIADYAAQFEAYRDLGVDLINTPTEHARASELEHWYPLIAELTPRSEVYSVLPSCDEVEEKFGWPVFLKGSRQTSKHAANLSVIENRRHYASVAELYARDRILGWQKPVIREFVPLLPVPGAVPGKVRPSLEFRSFWWQGECVGWGRYWYQVPPYGEPDIAAGLLVAGEAARRLAVPFLVVDIARTVTGEWIVIECNDAQESGYASISPYGLWREILARIERTSGAGSSAAGCVS